MSPPHLSHCFSIHTRLLLMSYPLTFVDGWPLAASSLSGAIPLHPSGNLPPLSLLAVIGAHLLVPTSMLCRAPTSCSGDPRCPPLLAFYCMNTFTIDLCRKCCTIQFIADSGVICDTLIPHTDLDEICLRAASPTDFGGLYCKSYDLPNSSIPVLPSYDLKDLPDSCASRPMTTDRSQLILEMAAEHAGRTCCCRGL